MTGTARGPERRTRRAIHEIDGSPIPGAVGLGETAQSSSGATTGSSENERGADAHFGSAQSLLRARRERTAQEIKELHRELSDFSDDDLRRIPVLAEGTTLEQGATYLDLQEANRREFTARGTMRVGPDNWIVAKASVDYGLWNRLRRVDH